MCITVQCSHKRDYCAWWHLVSGGQSTIIIMGRISIKHSCRERYEHQLKSTNLCEHLKNANNLVKCSLLLSFVLQWFPSEWFGSIFSCFDFCFFELFLPSSFLIPDQVCLQSTYDDDDDDDDNDDNDDDGDDDDSTQLYVYLAIWHSRQDVLLHVCVFAKNLAKLFILATHC